jgi:lipoprotein NlpD
MKRILIFFSALYDRILSWAEYRHVPLCLAFLILLFSSFYLFGCSYQETYAPVVDAWHDPSAMMSRYRVQKDDTIYSIALGFDIDYRDLAKANHLSPPYALRPGQTLTMQINPQRREEVKEGEENVVKTFAMRDLQNKPVDGFQEIPVATKVLPQESGFSGEQEVIDPPPTTRASKQTSHPPHLTAKNIPHSTDNNTQTSEVDLPDMSLQSIHPKIYASRQPLPASKGGTIKLSEKTALSNRDRIVARVNPGGWQWPAQGDVLKGFSLQMGGNKGIDIAGNLGDPVRAVAPGKVVYSGSGLRGYGNLVIIKHSDNYLSAYAYNKKLLVKEGDVVKAGAEIAKMGQNDAGRVMLHFEIRRNGKPVNPLLYL